MNPLETLRNVVGCLREDGRYIDEEGEATNALAELAERLACNVPTLYPTHADNAVAWAVSRWNDEVKHRPLVNVHRRTLDDTWRQVIRHFGGDPDKLLGPSHDTLHMQAQEDRAWKPPASGVGAAAKPCCGFPVGGPCPDCPDAAGVKEVHRG